LDLRVFFGGEKTRNLETKRSGKWIEEIKKSGNEEIENPNQVSRTKPPYID
jgi:hypothetical protein